MIRDFKYIIKRIIIGVGIALVLMFLKHGLILNTQAKEISSVWAPFSSTNTFGLTNMTEQVSVGLNTGNWANWGFGKLRFNFTLIKVSGSATAPLVVPQNVVVNNILCDINSTSSSNSTFTGQSYTATCSMNMGSNGLNSLVIFFTPNQQNEQSSYRLTVGNMFTFETDEKLNFDTSGTTNAINNQITNDNTNTQNIINNQNSNKQDIINNQNSNTEKEIESQKVCTTYDNTYTTLRGYINSNGDYVSDTSSSYSSNFIPINSSNSIKVLRSSTGNYRLCFYDDSKSLISCVQFKNYSVGSSIIIPNGSYYLRYALERSANAPRFELCKNGNQAIVNSQQNINNTLNDDNVDSQQASSFFSNFHSNSHGLSGIITSPLRLIESLSTSQCSPLVLPLPFVKQSATIPCMSSVYERFPTFYSLWQLISTGIIAYYILINLFAKVHSLQNPQDDRIEVLNL